MSTKFDSTFKEHLIKTLTDDLKMLRSKAGLTQNELADRMGVSRQLYALLEHKTQKMTWSNFLALLFIFKSNPDTHRIIDLIGVCPPELESFLTHPNEALEQASGAVKLSDDDLGFVAAAGNLTGQDNNFKRRKGDHHD